MAPRQKNLKKSSPVMAASSKEVKLQVGDVLFGRGSGVSHHPGNVRFRLLVKLYKEEYNKTVRQGKMLVAETIVNELKSMKPPGRFLEKNDKLGKYMCVQHRAAIEKTAQALRERKWSPFSRSEAYATLQELNTSLSEVKDLNSCKLPTVPPKPPPKTPTPSPQKGQKKNGKTKGQQLVVKGKVVKKGTTAKKQLTKTKPMVKASRPANSPDTPQLAPPQMGGQSPISGRLDSLDASQNLPTTDQSTMKLKQSDEQQPKQPKKQSSQKPPSALPKAPKLASTAATKVANAVAAKTGTLKPPKAAKVAAAADASAPRGKFKRLERIVNDALQEEFDLYLAHLPSTIYEAYYLAHFAATASETAPPLNDAKPVSFGKVEQTKHEEKAHEQVVDSVEHDDEQYCLTV